MISLPHWWRETNLSARELATLFDRRVFIDCLEVAPVRMRLSVKGQPSGEKSDAVQFAFLFAQFERATIELRGFGIVNAFATQTDVVNLIS